MPITPYVVNGTAIDGSSSVVSNTVVIAHNTTTDERTSTTTNSLGQFILDLANLTSGYSTGDAITVYIRNNGFVGETSFTLSGESYTANISTKNQVTLSTLRNTLWDSFTSVLKSGTFVLSTSLTDSFGNSVMATIQIYSAMNDKIIEDIGYPLIIISQPEI